VYIQANSSGQYVGFSFGEFYSYKTNGPDNYRAMIIGKAYEGQGWNGQEYFDKYNRINTATPAHFLSRNFSGFGSGMTFAKGGDTAKGVGSYTYAGAVPFPNPTDGAIYLSRCPIMDNLNYTTRGHMRGFWHFCHPISSVSDLQQFSGSGDLSGRTFMIIKQSINSGVYCMETSNTVETN
jgi:hypothetical protein